MISFSGLNYFGDMDKEHIVLLAGVTISVLSIGAFIFWGPTPPDRRRGAVIGLQNLGLTCFLNTLLQSLASCVYFIDWLETYKDQGPVASSLFFFMKVLSKDRSELPPSIEDPMPPTCVINALKQHGWSMDHGEQDAHELFHLIIVSLEEEAHKSMAEGAGLPEVLDPPPTHQGKEDVKETSCGGDNKDMLPISNGSLSVMNESVGDSITQPDTSVSPPLVVNRQGELINRRLFPKYDCNRNYHSSPFCGLLTSQLQCTKCHFKSVLKYDKFDSLSLHLMDKPRVNLTLRQLLHKFTQPEEVADVACDGCNAQLEPGQPRVTATSLKTLTVGKLPKCLCIHIHRLSLGPNGTPYKRSDYVNFPEYLNMDPYTQISIAKEQKLKEEISLRVGNGTAGEQLSDNINLDNKSNNHIYRLKAVVVHSGTADSGHFITYRRGPFVPGVRHRSGRWYYTSDDTVRSATLAEAMQALAYMLFYEKHTPIPT